MTGQFCSQDVYDAAVAAQAETTTTPSPAPSPVMTDFTRVKLPAWQPDEPAFWFELADEQFSLFTPAPSEKQKSALAGTIIPIDLLKQHRDARADAEKPYTKLKEAICGARVKSDIDLCSALLDAKLGPDEQPSDFLRRFFTTFAEVKGKDGKPMATAAQIKGWLAKQILERQLPPVVSSAMVADGLEATSPQVYMDKADLQLKAFKANQATVAAIAASVEDKADDIAAIRPKGKGGSTKKSGGAKSGGKGLKCFFHERFGDKAERCKGGDCVDKDKPLASRTN